jgi:hypothetical protein
MQEGDKYKKKKRRSLIEYDAAGCIITGSVMAMTVPERFDKHDRLPSISNSMKLT